MLSCLLLLLVSLPPSSTLPPCPPPPPPPPSFAYPGQGPSDRLGATVRQARAEVNTIPMDTERIQCFVEEIADDVMPATRGQ
eukprot:4137457-Pyramimonas_sp.AAC.1